MLGRRYSPSFLQGTRPRFASDTLMSLRAIPSSSLGYLVLQQRIYAPLRVSVFGVRCGPAGVAVDSRWFCVRPVPSELGRGRLSRFSLLPGGLVFCVWGCGERPCDTLRALPENVAAPRGSRWARLYATSGGCVEVSVASVATSGCPKRSEGGCPCRSEEGSEPRANPAGWFVVWACAPCLANWGGGGLSRFSVLLGGWRFACRHTKARHRHTTAAGNHFKKS